MRESGANIDNDLRFVEKSQKPINRRLSHLPYTMQGVNGQSNMAELDRASLTSLKSLQLVNKEKFLAEYGLDLKKVEVNHHELLIVNDVQRVTQTEDMNSFLTVNSTA